MKIFLFASNLLLASGLSAQQYVISTVAGGAPPVTPIAGTIASIGYPSGVATDGTGNLYFTSLNCVFKLDQNGVLTRVAGTSRSGYSGDGGSATNAELQGPSGIAVDVGGNLYIADGTRIRKVTTSGVITTVAGNGTFGYSGDGGPATNAQLSLTSGVAVDRAGNIFIADGGFVGDNNRVRKVSTSGIITTVAGGGPASPGDGGPAISAQLSPYGVAVDDAGNLYIGDESSLRKVSVDGIITTVAGSGGSIGAYGIAVDGIGNLFFADIGSSRIWKVSTNGIITTVAGNGFAGFSGDGGPATSASLYDPIGVAVDSAGNIFIADPGVSQSGNSRIRRVSSAGTITTVVGDGTANLSGDGGPARQAQLGAGPGGLALDGEGDLFIADNGNGRVRKINSAGIITTLAGGGSAYPGDGGPATSSQLKVPTGVAVDAAGNVFIAEDLGSRIRKVSANGIITTVAGTGSPGFSGDGGPATNAQLFFPNAVAPDGAGNLFIADTSNYRIRKVSANGIITTVAGTGSSGSSGDGGPATNAQLQNPTSIAFDAVGNLYIADATRVRKIATSGVITTVAGGGTAYPGDGGPATNAQLNTRFNVAMGIAIDKTGSLIISDAGDARVRKVSTSGIITTIAGTGGAGSSGDGGLAINAEFGDPYGVAVDGVGNVYVEDSNIIRLLTPTNQLSIITAVVDAASESAIPVSPGKIVVLYGGGLGPSQLVQNQPSSNQFGTQLSGTTVSFNGIAAPILYSSAMQVAAIVPYEISGTTAQITVGYQGQISSAFTIPVAALAPSLFTYNGTGAGQAAAINAVDGTINTAADPVKVGSYISLFATGEGQTTPAGVDGKLGGSIATHPNLSVTATVGGIPATVQYAGGVFGDVAGLMQVNVLIPAGVQPGGYVPVVLQVGNASTVAGAIWIAVAGN